MFKRSVQLSLALSILSTGLASHAQSHGKGHSYHPKIKSERALKEALKDIRKMLGMPSPAPSRPVDVSTGLDPSMVAAAEAEQCLVSICGPARVNQSGMDVYLERTMKPSLSAQKAWTERFDGRLKQSLKSQQEIALQLLRTQKEELEKGRPVNERIPMRAFVGFMAAVLEASEKMSGFVMMSTDQSGIVENTVQVEAYLQTLPAEKRDAVRLAIKKFYLPMVQMNFLGMGGNPLAARLKMLYGNQSAKEALTRDARLLLAEVERIRTSFSSVMVQLMMQSLSTDSLDRAAQGQDLSASDSQAYLEATMTIGMMSVIFDGGKNYQALMKFPVDFEALRKKMIENSTIEKSLITAQSIDLDRVALQIANVCSNKLTASLDMGASDLRLRRGKIMVQQIKEASKKVARRFNSDPVLQQAAEERIDQIQFKMPESYNDKLEKLEAVLAEQRRSAQAFRAINWDDHEGRDVLLMFSLLSGLGSTLDGINLTFEESEMKKACEALPVGTLSDFSMTSLGNISVSWFTLNYPTVGSGVVAHEIGHVVSRILRSQRLAAFWGMLSLIP